MPSDEERDMDNSEQNDQPISDKQLMELAGKLGNTWQSLAIQHLGFKAYEVENFISDGNSNQDKAFKMLQSWKCREKCPTVGDLIHILDKADTDSDAWLFLCNKGSKYNGHFFSNPSPSGYNCSVKTVIVKANTIQKKGTEALENLFQELFESNINLLLKFRKIVNSMESKILNIVPGCVEARLQILSYTALLKLSLLPVKGGSEGIKRLAPLHQKLQNAMEEELPDVNITNEMLSFTNYFEGGSYRKALEYFCKGFAIDDMLPIIKKPKQFQNIDYLCIDIKNDPGTTLSDLKREFVKQRYRKLHEFQRKVLKGKPMSKSDYSLNIMSIDNVLNKPKGKCGKKFKKDTDKELPGQQEKTFEVVSFSKLRYKPKKCYGCGKNIRDVADSDLILKTQDVREYYSGCRQRHLTIHKSNVYFHFLEKCVRKKYGLINQHTFLVPNIISGCMTGAQHTMLRSMENIQDVGDTKFQSKMGRNDLEPY
ncbi:uncharacterized protein LOC122558819 isoform X2 [Chiloscyllium plagiosum]|uniref:uncharacterized protein LOC122558819 isoform X2 n=1 Tax=Chiloscyllium plagiosum TaxID=36176 RepID=UPI001CB80A98|nr:uncharacterized protein LOC122558819 isoform X2 [Chiloscyllium plagiosum]